MATTPKGIWYPGPNEPNNISAHLQSVAEYNDANPGIANLSTVARDALTGSQLWDGRVVFNTTLGYLEVYRSETSSWVAVVAGTVDATTATLIQDGESATASALSASFAKRGTQQIAPSVTLYESRAELQRRVFVHDEDDAIYAAYSRTGATFTCHKTTDMGATWVAKGNLPWAPSAMAKMSNGTLLAFKEVTTLTPNLCTVARSTDDGATWTETFTMGWPPLGPNSICEMPDGSILFAEYGNVGSSTYRILRSTDDGVTATAALTGPGDTSSGDPGHFHSVTWDPIEGCAVAFCDLPITGTTGPRIYKGTDNGATWTLLGEAITEEYPNFVAPMYGDDYIAWGSDNQRNGVVSRISREDFYAGNFGEVEDIAFLNRKAAYSVFPLRDNLWAMTLAAELISPLEEFNADGPGSYAQEVYLVDPDAGTVTGGFSHFRADTTPGTLNGFKMWFPHFRAGRRDHAGLAWVNVLTGSPRTYAAVPFSQGDEPPMQKSSGWLLGGLTLPNYVPLKFKDPSGAAQDGVFMDDAGRLVLTNTGVTLATRPSIRLSNTGDIEFQIGGVTKSRLHASTGVFQPIQGVSAVPVAVNGLSIYGGNGNPEGVQTATPGCLYLNWNGGLGVAVYYKATGTGNTGWQPINAPLTRTSTELQTASDIANTVGKVPGRMVWDGTLGRPVYAYGTSPTSPWRFADGTTAHTPS